MNGVEITRREVVESLAHRNRKFYKTEDGRGLLRALDLTFEHRWIYIFELVQNALDAGARSIMIRLVEDDGVLILQHDGISAIDNEDVQGLSKVFRSTKGASTVGFMGIGFKSVFRRFREARIAGWSWTFRYELRQERGEQFGDVQTDLLGAVIPIWDNTIEPPEADFTTRFEMRQCMGSAADLRDDVERFLPDDDRTLLAILAAAGLERLDVDGCIWKLDICEGTVGSRRVKACSPEEQGLWQVFPVPFVPSRDAIGRFLEHRRLSAAEYLETQRKRQVLGVLPLDDNGCPEPPPKGRVYATLPTDVMLPFRLHINADWLVSISRNGLLDIGDNAWQREIVDRIADVLASVFGWVARTFSDREAVKTAFAMLMPPLREAGRLEALFADERWLAVLRDRFEDAAVIPVWVGKTDTLAFAKPQDVIVPPSPLADAFEERPALLPAVLLKGPVLVSDVIGPGARQLLNQAGLLAEMLPQELERSWLGGLEIWWEALDGDGVARRDLLFHLWAAVSRLGPEGVWPRSSLLCVRTANEAWCSVEESVFLAERVPSPREPGGVEAYQLLKLFLPEPSRCLPDGWFLVLRQQESKEQDAGSLSSARNWIENHATRVELSKVTEGAVKALIGSPTPDWPSLVALGHWAKHRNRHDLLSHMLVESKAGHAGVPASNALLADPYVERGQCRRRLFPTLPIITASYVEQDPKSADGREWREFLERAGALGTLRVRHKEQWVGRWRGRPRVAELLDVESNEIDESNDDGYKVLDFDIEPDLPGMDAPIDVRAAIAAWLEDGFSALKSKGHWKVDYFFRYRYERIGKRPSTWVNKLSDLAWVPCIDDTLRRPRDVLSRPDPVRENAPVAKLDPDLLFALEQEGVKFGTEIPEATALRRLSETGSLLPAEELAKLLREIREQAATDEDKYRFEQTVCATACAAWRRNARQTQSNRPAGWRATSWRARRLDSPIGTCS